jgi:hypothetical protein
VKRVDYQYALLVTEGDRTIGFVVCGQFDDRIAKPDETPTVWDERDEALHTADKVLQRYERLGLGAVLGDLAVKLRRRAVATLIGEWEE